jgi:hypothetical protein
MITKIAVLTMISLFSSIAVAEQQHHDFTVTICRALPTGNVQIRGTSAVDGQLRDVIFDQSSLSETVMNRFLSLCLTSFSTGDALRIDYLDCVGLSCNPTAFTTLNLQK